MNIILIISTFMPLVAAYFVSKFFVFLPLILLFVFMIFLILQKKKIYKISNSILSILIILNFISIYQLIFKDGIGSGGILILFFEIIILYEIFKLQNFKLEKFIKLFIIVYFLHIICLYFEFFIRLSGLEYFLVDFFGNTNDIVTKFKIYNSAPHITQNLGLKGLNSAMLGSQIASVLSLIVLFQSYYGQKMILKKKSFFKFFFIISLISYIFTMTQTSNLIMLSIFFLSLFFNLELFTKHKTKYYILIFLISIIFFITDFSFKEIFFFKLKEAKDFEIYLSLFTEPFKEYLLLNMSDTLFGIGQGPWIYQATTDLGFFGILFRVGIVYFVIINFIMIIIFFTGYRSFKSYLSNNIELSYFYIFNIISIFIYWGSLIHYTSVVELGARELFAFHISSLIYMQNNMKNN